MKHDIIIPPRNSILTENTDFCYNCAEYQLIGKNFSGILVVSSLENLSRNCSDETH